MPFFLYECSLDASRVTNYKCIKQIKVAGSDGPISLYVREQNRHGELPFAWHMTEQELLTKLNVSPQNHALVIDLKPSMKNNVSLCRLKHIWGFSYNEWTPMLVRLETLFMDKKENNPTGFKQQFNDRNAQKDYVHEFLYLQGGVKEGTWNWGMVGRVNGALLWPDALDYFIGELKKARP